MNDANRKPARPGGIRADFLLPPRETLHRMIEGWVAEDEGVQDLTTSILIPPDAAADFSMNTRQEIVVAGIEVSAEVFRHMAPDARVEVLAADGARIGPGTRMMGVAGDARTLLTVERTALNILQFMCGIATLVAEYARLVAHTDTQLIDTRKTVPGMRLLSKYAACVGGARPHRLGLHDGVIVKDNHIAVHGSIARAVAQARALTPALTKIEVECDTLEQVEEAAAAGADVIMFDNMSAETMREGIRIIDGRARTEASGGITLDTVREKAEAGVDVLSIGRMTQSAPAVDIGLDIAVTTSS